MEACGDLPGNKSVTEGATCNWERSQIYSQRDLSGLKAETNGTNTILLRNSGSKQCSQSSTATLAYTVYADSANPSSNIEA